MRNTQRRNKKRSRNCTLWYFSHASQEKWNLKVKQRLIHVTSSPVHLLRFLWILQYQQVPQSENTDAQCSELVTSYTSLHQDSTFSNVSMINHMYYTQLHHKGMMFRLQLCKRIIYLGKFVPGTAVMGEIMSKLISRRLYTSFQIDPTGEFNISSLS